MDNPIQVDLGRIAQDLQIRRVQVESVVQLLDEGNTVPFITRYRKERTGNLNEVVIHEIQLRVQRLRELAERKETILKAIEAQGKLNDELALAIRSADNPKRLEDLYLPFKPKKRTKASDARERGLEPLAVRIWNRDETLIDLTAAAVEFLNPEKGVDTPEKVLEGVGHILAEAVSEMAAVRDAVRKMVWKTGKIVTAKGEIPEGQGLEYRDYFEYSEPVAQVPPHRVLAINRGDKEGPLKVRIEVPRPDLEGAFFTQIPLEAHPQGEFFRAAAIDALDRLILPSMEREVRRELTDAAEKHAVEVFARNLRSLLLQPPIPRQVVLAIDPGLRSGCKVAVLDPTGNLLDHGVVYPHAPQNRRSEAKVFLKDLVGKHKVGVVAIGNGTACRETEELIAEIIAEGLQFSQEAAYLPSTEAAGTPPTENGHTGESSLGDSAPPVENTTVAEASIAAQDGAPGDSSPAASHVAGEETAALDSAPAAEDATVPSVTDDSNIEPSLPPISGGAPDSIPSETEAVPEGSESQPEGNHQDHKESRAQAEAPHATTQVEDQLPAPGADATDQATASDATAAIAAENPESHAPSDAEESIAPSYVVPDPLPGEEDAEDSGESEEPPLGQDSDTPASVTEAPVSESQVSQGADQQAAGQESGPSGAEPVPTPPSRPQSESRRGKHDQRRDRGSRGKSHQGPPPTQLPPAPHPADGLLAQLAYVIVNEAGASVYSTSQVGREELPEFDATLRSAISIGRRLQDPLAELVKIEPQNIGVGLYQHDVNPKQLKETLDSVISSCVNFVGVDLNTASVPLLRHVSGLNQLTARRIVDRRREKSPFHSRQELMEVEGIGPATFIQAAGFLKITDGTSPLDRTWVHPESYEAATGLLGKLGESPEVVLQRERLPEVRNRLAEADVPELARELNLGEFTLRDIIEALGRPERDPRDDLPKPIFKKGILKLEDLTPEMELKGTVLNVVDFGAFVDIGLKDSGLVHISQLANRYIKSPHDVVSVGDVVTVWVMGVDQERKRVSLTMVKPGTERQRGPQAGGRRGPGGPEAKEGQGPSGRRGAPRGPRPSGSSLTSPPVGAPSISALTEAPHRRPDRERGGHSGGPGRPGDGGHGQGGGEHRNLASPGQGQGGGYRGGPHGQGRGGPRGHGPGGRPGPGRPERPQNDSRPPRPARPAPPPPPLSKEALTGSVPLRSFGQLKQLWQARVEPEGEEGGPTVQAQDQAGHDHGPAIHSEPSSPSTPTGEQPPPGPEKSDHS